MIHRRLSHVAVALCLAAFATAARATVTIHSSTYVLGGSSASDTLAANGWDGILLTATSDGAPIASFDLDAAGGGIYGILEQYSFISGASRISTPTGTVPSTSAGSTVDLADSFISDFTGFSLLTAVPPAEDNSLTSHAASPLQSVSHDYSFSPVVDDSAHDYGLGQRLHVSQGFTAQSSHPTSVPIAFVIVPHGSVINVVGTFVDFDPGNPNPASTNVNVFISTPEPASLGMLAAGGLALIARRRRKA